MIKLLPLLDGEEMVEELNTRSVSFQINIHVKCGIWIDSKTDYGLQESFSIEGEQLAKLIENIDKMSDDYKSEFIEVCKKLNLC